METKKEDNIVMYIILNSDLSMTKGKCVSQACHVVQLITEKILRSGYESDHIPEEYIIYKKWSLCPTKIVLKATTEQLIRLSKMDGASEMIDDGQTQVHPDSLTCVGFAPSNKLYDIMKDFKLL
ncbi:MAG: peptidyl-tRNA hydrolase [Edafosvirus sp.]|uniref:peptidyl-tRNA hydrolase n=1 Tax=Edafosvirus sp. TaxID=2487765 RepID=A0A3G4ZS88_9VIRU|nr:MAG: peptidyl-tRNA hydrolase [Edafosvirus sp.]